LGEGFDQSYPFFKVNIFRTGTGALHNKIITEALALALTASFARCYGFN
jgi:hypothetical protein